MMHDMLDIPIQFKEKKLVLQKGLAWETGPDYLLVGIEQQKSQGCTNHHHDGEQKYGQ